MFSARAHSAVLAWRTTFASVRKPARFLSVGNHAFTKNMYSESALLSEKPNKSIKARCNNKYSEASKLYPDELEKLNECDLLEQYAFLDDDYDDDDNKGSLVEKGSGSVKPTNVAKEVKNIELKIPERKNMKVKEHDLAEKLSDSDSESDTEKNEIDFNYIKPGSKFNFKERNLDELKIIRLPKRSDFLRSEMDKLASGKSGLVVNYDIYGIFELSRSGVLPESVFFCDPKVLSFFPGGINSIVLYHITYEDLSYWAPKHHKGRVVVIGLYKEENLRKPFLEESQIPMTIVCDHIFSNQGFAQVINSASVCPPKSFITSKDCPRPWSSPILRATYGNIFSLNHNFELSWEEIGMKIDENSKIFVSQPTFSKMDVNFDRNEADWSSLPSVDLYDHNFWARENITLILRGSTSRKSIDKGLQFCLDRKAVNVKIGITRRVSLAIMFNMVFFEIRRQWLAMKNEKVSRSWFKNGKTSK